MTVRDRTIIGVLCLAAVIVGGWLLIIQPKRAQASRLETQITAEQAQLAGVRTQLAAGTAAKAAFASSYTSLVRLGEAVPTDDNTPSLIYQLQTAAKATKVDFESLTFDAGAGGGTAPAASGSSASLPPGVTIGPAGFPIEPFTFTFTGNFFNLANFFQRLQRFVVQNGNTIAVNGRLMTLNSIALAAGPSGFPQVAATIEATTFLLPSSQGLTAGATPGGPAPSTTQTVSTTKSSNPAPAAPAVITSPVR